MSRVSRRWFLQKSGAAATGVALAGLPKLLRASPRGFQKPRSRRSLRIAYLTDIHIQPELQAPEGLTACLRNLRSLSDQPDLIINGGDAIMDALGATEERTQLQWKLWNELMKDMPERVEHCLGNHDIWGWNKTKSHTTGKEPLFGKTWAMTSLGMEKPYRSFDAGSWHFVILDSTFPNEEKIYEARLDEEQFAWLERDLSSVQRSTPVVVISHIPILTACGFFHVPNSEKTGDWVMLGQLMHLDAARIMTLFRKQPNIKLCLSGHIHLTDRVDYDGITYVCNGAVSGAWWKGRFRETDPGYGLIDLYEDGSFSCDYRVYGRVEENRG